MQTARPEQRPPLLIAAFMSLPSPKTIERLHLDADVLVLNKPAGLRIAPDRSGRVALPESAATATEPSSLFDVVPIDADASGVLLLARSEDVRKDLVQQLAEGVLHVCVLALVRASFVGDGGTIDRPIDGPSRHRRGDAPDGTPARTDWRVRDGFVGFALLECHPRTSAQGQIRRHLAAVGMPLAVDPVCGGAEELMLSSFKAGYRPSRRHSEKPLIIRATLHSESVRFRHPKTGASMRLEAPIPRDFRATLHQLDRFGRIGPGGLCS